MSRHSSSRRSREAKATRTSRRRVVVIGGMMLLFAGIVIELVLSAMRGFARQHELAARSAAAPSASPPPEEAIRQAAATSEPAAAPPAVRQVANAGDFNRALAMARPGDRIVLASGSYEDIEPPVLRNGGRRGQPIIIEAAAPQQAVLRSRLVVQGDHVEINGLVFEQGGLIIGGDGCRVSNCLFTATREIALVLTHGRGVRIDHNEFAGCLGRGLSIKPDHRRPAALRAPQIDHNYFHDFAGARRGTNVHEPLQVGQTKTDTDISLHAIVEYNLFERVSIDTECISVKSSDNIIRFNTVLDSDSSITNRHGERNSYIANWIENSRGFMIHDRGNRLIGNRVTGSGRFGMRIMGGNVGADTWPLVGSHPAALDTLLAGNEADRLVIGDTFGKHNLPAEGTRIEAHRGPVEFRLERGTVRLETTGQAVPSPRRLRLGDIGPSFG